MSKIVESSYHTVDETIAAVERLLSEGRVMSDIVIITSNDNYSDIRNRTLVEVDKVSTDGDKGMWEKFKEMFTDVGEEGALEHYGIDKQTAIRYDSVLKSGNYVILVEESKDIPIQQHLEDGPRELGLSDKEQAHKKPIGQSGSGTKIITDTSHPTGRSPIYNDKNADLLNQESNFSDNRFAERKEDPTNLNVGFQKARQGMPIGQTGSGIRKTKDTTLPVGESSMPTYEDRQSNEQTVQEDKIRFTGESIDKADKHKQKPNKKNQQLIDNPLQGKPTEATDFEIENRRETAVEDSPDLPRFSGGSITGQPVIDPFLDDE